jgi:uncharacterized protein YeaO (DUF488 family)
MKQRKVAPAKDKPQRPHSRRQSPSIGIKRVYDEPARDDGVRILIDRLWPRGVSKAALKLDAWPRALAPSTELRKWYGHDPKLFAEFRRRYRKELAGEKEELGVLRAMIRGPQSDAAHGDARARPESRGCPARVTGKGLSRLRRISCAPAPRPFQAPGAFSPRCRGASGPCRSSCRE